MRGGTGIDTLPTRHTGMALRTQTRALTRYTRAGMRTVRAEHANCICRTVRRSSSDHKSAAQNSGTNAWVARDGLPCMRRRTAEPNTRVAAAALESTRSSACSSHSAEVEVVEQPATVVEPCSWPECRARRGSQRRQRPSQHAGPCGAPYTRRWASRTAKERLLLTPVSARQCACGLA